MKMNVYLPDGKETKFRKAVYERLGYKRGNLNKAFEQAIDLWLVDQDSVPKTRSSTIKNFSNKAKPKNDLQAYAEVADDINFIDEYRNLSFEELYLEYQKTKTLNDSESMKRRAALIKLMNKIIDAKNRSTGKLESRPVIHKDSSYIY